MMKRLILATALIMNVSLGAMETVSLQKVEKEKEKQDCVICITALFNEEDDVVTLNCKSGFHSYHAGCITEWVQERGTDARCPLCNTHMSDEEEKEASDCKRLYGVVKPRFKKQKKVRPKLYYVADLIIAVSSKAYEVHVRLQETFPDMTDIWQ